MQVQSMGTHCQVSSQFIKKDLQFLGRVPISPSEGIEPGSPNPESSALPLSYLAVDKDLGLESTYIYRNRNIIINLKAVKAIRSPKIKGRTASFCHRQIGGTETAACGSQRPPMCTVGKNYPKKGRKGHKKVENFIKAN